MGKDSEGTEKSAGLEARPSFQLPPWPEMEADWLGAATKNQAGESFVFVVITLVERGTEESRMKNTVDRRIFASDRWPFLTK